MLSFRSAILLAPVLAILPALAAPAASVTPAVSATPSPPVITPGVMMDLGEWAKVQSYKTVQPWGGMGDEEWFFKFDATYTAEDFAVTLWAEPSGTIAYTGYEWTTAKPTATLSCNVHVTAAPTDSIFMTVADVTPYVPTPTVSGATMTCVPTS